MKPRKPGNSMSRRQFLGSVILVTTSASIITACKKPSWQIGCYTRPWAKHDYRVALDGIAGAGFKFAGLTSHINGLIIAPATPHEEAVKIGEEAKSRGLKIASLYSGNFNVRNSIEEGIKELQNMIDNSVNCGCPNLMLAGINTHKLIDPYYKVIAECCDYAADKGVGISLKPHGPFNSTGAECRHYIEKVGHKNFRLWYDPGNIYFYSNGEFDPVDDVEDVDGLVVGMSVKDFRLPKEINITPGTGMVDFQKVLSRLREGGFTQGPLIVECISISDNVDFINAEARKACLFLEELTSIVNKTA